ncbi:MAG: hypothetical protein PVS2B3_07370 [Steroidobacteraceae bacterium]
MRSPGVELRFTGSHAGFAQAFVRLRGALDEQRLAGAARYNTELVFEELVANIVSHGAADGRELDVRVTLETRAEVIILTFEDDGAPFDPRGRPDPAPARSLEEARVGGFGLMLVRHAARSLDYARTAEGRNRLTVSLARA